MKSRISIMLCCAIGCSTSSTPVVDASIVDVEAAPDSVAVDARMCCNDDINGSASKEQSMFDTVWLAWKYVPSCSKTASAIWVSSNTKAMAVLEDSAGQPGSPIIPETTAAPSANGSIAEMTLARSTSTPVWIAIKNVQPGSITDGSLTPFANSGIPTDWVTSNQLSGPWSTPLKNPAIFKVSECP